MSRYHWPQYSLRERHWDEAHRDDIVETESLFTGLYHSTLRHDTLASEYERLKALCIAMMEIDTRFREYAILSLSRYHGDIFRGAFSRPK